MIKKEQEFTKIGNHITLFNVNISKQEQKQLLTQLEPVMELLMSHPKNSVYIYKNAQRFHSEALIRVREKYASANSIGLGIPETISSLIPKLIEATSVQNLFPRSKQLNYNSGLSVVR